jgi:sulfur carrier protein ThiS
MRYAPAGSQGAIDLELPDGARAADVLAHFALPVAERTIIGLNGEAVAPDTVVPDGARLDLLQPISGGAAGGVKWCDAERILGSHSAR